MHTYIVFQGVLQMCSDISGLCYPGNIIKHVPGPEVNLIESNGGKKINTTV